MKNARIWIEKNTNTGDQMTFEIYFQAEDEKRFFVASCKTYESAKKSVQKKIKTNSPFYNITFEEK